MSRIKLLACVASAVLAAAAQPACARGWFAGLDVGHATSEANFPEFSFDSFPAERASSTGVQLRFGYQLWTYFAVEAGYLDFGDFDRRISPENCPGGASPCPITTRTSMRGSWLDVVGTLPLGTDWALNARAGIVRTTVDFRELGAGSDGGSGDHGGMLFGLGATYHLGEHWDLSVDWRTFQVLDFGIAFGGGVGAFDNGNSQLTSLGVGYRW